MLIVLIADVWNGNYPLLKAKWFKYRVARKFSGDIPLAPYIAYSSHASGSEPHPSRSKYFLSMQWLDLYLEVCRYYGYLY